MITSNSPLLYDRGIKDFESAVFDPSLCKHYPLDELLLHSLQQGQFMMIPFPWHNRFQLGLLRNKELTLQSAIRDTWRDEYWTLDSIFDPVHPKLQGTPRLLDYQKAMEDWHPFLIRGLLEDGGIFKHWVQLPENEGREWLGKLGAHLSPKYQAHYLVNLASELAEFFFIGRSSRIFRYLVLDKKASKVRLKAGFISVPKDSLGGRQTTLVSLNPEDHGAAKKMIKDLLELAEFYQETDSIQNRPSWTS